MFSLLLKQKKLSSLLSVTLNNSFLLEHSFLFWDNILQQQEETDCEKAKELLEQKHHLHVICGIF